jgi:hypothetical protein
MNFHALDMPDEPTRLAAWLEQRLAAPELTALVDELSAFQTAPRDPAPALRELLGEWHELVLAGGLKLAPPEVLQRMLSWPERLLDLQELVFERGGRYWDRVLESAPDLRERVQHSRQRLSAVLLSPGPTQAPERAPGILPLRKPVSSRRLRWSIGVAAAAAIAAAILIARSFPPTPTAPAEVAWGWNKPGVLAADGSAAAYLNRLADAADEWFTQRPDNTEAVANRLHEFRRGCTSLLLAEHRPLSEEDRKWLSEKCRQWAGKIDAALAEAEEGQAQKGRDDADEMVHRLAAALREKAAERGAA